MRSWFEKALSSTKHLLRRLRDKIVSIDFKRVGRSFEPRLRQWFDAGRGRVSNLVQDSKTLVASLRGKSPSEVFSSAVQGTGSILRKRDRTFYGYASALVLGTYFVSDLTALVVDAMIPEPRPIRFAEVRDFSENGSSSEYDVIMGRNLFNSRGLIPGEDGGNWANAPAVRTSLPIELIGTVVLTDETRSLGTLADKSSQKVYPVRIGDEIPGKLRTTKVEGRRVTFINLMNRRPEYVELPEDTAAPVFSFASTGMGKKAGIDQLSPTRFVVARKEIDDSIANIHKILTEARAIPHFENGVPSGFRLTQIVAGSIYEKLGLKDDDILNGINGESITNDPGKAWSYLNDLKSAKQIELSVKRNGKEMNLSYDIQ